MTELYIVRYSIDGKFTANASSPEEAREQFENWMSQWDQVGLLGDLVVDEPKTEAQDRREIAAITPLDESSASPPGPAE